MREVLEELKSKKVVGIECPEGLYLLVDANNDVLAERFVGGSFEDASKEVLIADINSIEQYFTELNPLIYDLVEFSEKPMLLILPHSKNIAASWQNAEQRIGIREEKDSELHKVLFQFRRAVVKVKVESTIEAVKFFKFNWTAPEIAIIAIDPSGKISILQK